MPNAILVPMGPSPDGLTVNLGVAVTSEPPGLRRVTILDRTRRRVSGLADSSATFELEGCPLAWNITLTGVLLDFFPIHVEIIQCGPETPGSRTVIGPLDRPDAQPPAVRPDCSDPTRTFPPSSACLQANMEAAAARAAAIGACARVRGLTQNVSSTRRRISDLMIVFAGLLIAAALSYLTPVGFAVAPAFIGAAIAVLAWMIYYVVRERAMSVEFADAEHRLMLAQTRFITLGSQVRTLCCPWNITADLSPVDCSYMPPWSIGRGKIGEPGERF